MMAKNILYYISQSLRLHGQSVLKLFININRFYYSFVVKQWLNQFILTNKLKTYHSCSLNLRLINFFIIIFPVMQDKMFPIKRLNIISNIFDIYKCSCMLCWPVGCVWWSASGPGPCPHPVLAPRQDNRSTAPTSEPEKTDIGSAYNIISRWS